MNIEIEKTGIFSKIESRQDALKISRDCAVGFLFISSLQASVGYFVAPYLMLNGIIFAVLGFILLKWHSRIAALLLLLAGAATIAFTLLTTPCITSNSASSLVIGLIIFWFAVRSVDATFKLHGEFPAALTGGESNAKNN